MEETEKAYYLGLDISTSVIGICLIEKNEQLCVLDAVKLTTGTLNMWQKADKGIEEIKRLVGGRKIEKIFVEANAKMFTQGFSSADTLLTLAKFNGIISYLSHKVFDAEVVDVNVSSARKAIGFKANKADQRSRKEQVFSYVTAMHPDYPWKTHVAKTGKSKGQEVFNEEMKDACDAFVIVIGGSRLQPKT